MHSQLPPKSGCRNHIPRFALSRRRATALFRNPVCKAQRSVPGFSSTPTSACRRYATSPPSAVAYIIGLPHPARCITKKTAEERFHMLARGWLAYPVTSIHSHLPPKSGCICQHIPRFALSRRRATALFRNPVCKAQRSVPGFSSTPNSACRRYATSPPSAVASPHRPPSSSDCPTRRDVSQKKPPKSGFTC